MLDLGLKATIAELVLMLELKRPCEPITHDLQADGLHVVIASRRGKLPIVISKELLECSPRSIVNRLDILNWQLVAGVSALALKGTVVPHFLPTHIYLQAKS